MTRSAPIDCRLVAHAKAGRDSAAGTGSDQREVRARPEVKSIRPRTRAVLIVASPKLEAPSARHLVNPHARRIQIELGFRDLKSHRYGRGMEDSLAQQGAWLQVLLLVSTLASFVSWLAGLGWEATGVAHWLSPRRSMRKLYQALLNYAHRTRSASQTMAA